jgi:D-lyxose ketol-isomerase
MTGRCHPLLAAVVAAAVLLACGPGAEAQVRLPPPPKAPPLVGAKKPAAKKAAAKKPAQQKKKGAKKPVPKKPVAKKPGAMGQPRAPQRANAQRKPAQPRRLVDLYPQGLPAKPTAPKPAPAKGAPAVTPDILKLDNAWFYKGGKFDVERGKDAVVALMKHHGYPVFPKIREKIWVSDYGLGQYTKVGLAAVMFQNNVKDRYMLMDLFLMPGQMLPEHWHLAGEGNPAKLEGWLVRHGQSHVVGEGADNCALPIPAIHDGGKVTVKHVVTANPGDFVPLNRAEAHHWQMAGPAGAIITEVANVHTDSAVRHQDKVMNDYFLKGG